MRIDDAGRVRRQRTADDARVADKVDRRAAGRADRAGAVIILTAFEAENAAAGGTNDAVVEEAGRTVGSDTAADPSVTAGSVDVDGTARHIGGDDVVVGDDCLVEADLARAAHRLAGAQRPRPAGRADLRVIGGVVEHDRTGAADRHCRQFAPQLRGIRDSDRAVVRQRRIEYQKVVVDVDLGPRRQRHRVQILDGPVRVDDAATGRTQRAVQDT